MEVVPEAILEAELAEQLKAFVDNGWKTLGDKIIDTSSKNREEFVSYFKQYADRLKPRQTTSPAMVTPTRLKPYDYQLLAKPDARSLLVSFESVATFVSDVRMRHIFLTAVQRQEPLTKLQFNGFSFPESNPLAQHQRLLLNALIQAVAPRIREFSILDLELDRPYLRTIIASLMQCKHLTSLKLYHCAFGNEEVTTLFDALSASTLALESLSLCHMRYWAVGGREIGRYLKDNTSLTFLDVSGNPLGYHGAKHIFEGLAFNKTMKTLVIAQINLNLTLVRMFPIFIRLDFSNTLEDEQRNRELFELLSKCSLTAIDLFRTPLDAMGHEIVCQALSKNTSLRKLKLSSTFSDSLRFGFGVMPDNAKQVIRAVAANQLLVEKMQLKSLTTDVFCYASAECLKAPKAAAAFADTLNNFLRVLVLNTSLKKLEFSDMAPVLAKNHTLVKLIARANLGLEALPYPDFLDFIKDNRTIQVVGDLSLFTEYYFDPDYLYNQSRKPYFKQCNEILMRNRNRHLIKSHMIPLLLALNSMRLEDGFGAMDVVKLVFGYLLDLHPQPAWMTALKS